MMNRRIERRSLRVSMKEPIIPLEHRSDKGKEQPVSDRCGRHTYLSSMVSDWHFENRCLQRLDSTAVRAASWTLSMVRMHKSMSFGRELSLSCKPSSPGVPVDLVPPLVVVFETLLAPSRLGLNGAMNPKRENFGQIAT
jgi:hypothetical protein